MSKGNQYKWLLVVEGISDTTTYASLLIASGIDASDFSLCRAGGNGQVRNAAAWDKIKCEGATLCLTLRNNLGRSNFQGVILIVDADTGTDFSNYQRSGILPYSRTAPATPVKMHNDKYWHVDTFLGVQEFPMYGIVVPATGAGCLETDLLTAYRFPIESQPEYSQLTDIIKIAGNPGYWNIPKHKDGKDWWEENEKAKLDKFIYAALTEGFKVSDEEPLMPETPPVITAIMTAMSVK